MKVYATCCDKCGRAIKDDEYKKSAHIIARQIAKDEITKQTLPPKQPFFDASWQERDAIDLCPECWYDVGQFIFGKK